MIEPVLTNIAAHSVDVNWFPPSSVWDALAITGYQVLWKATSEQEFRNRVVVGNVTITTIIGLLPNVQYEFKVAAMVEDQTQSSEWKIMDLYGRREIVPGALLGDFSPSVVSPTLLTAGKTRLCVSPERC